MRALSFALVVVCAACAGGSARPLAAVDSYVAALRAGDYGRAYDLMSDRYRKEHSREDFVRLMKESSPEVRQTVARLSSPNRRVEESATFKYDDLRDELQLVEEGGSWKIAGDPLDFYPQDTPQHALRSFLRAVQLKRWDIVLRFVPSDWREAMTEDKVREQFEGEKKEEMSALIQTITANLDNPVDVTGEKARMPYGDRSEVRFKKEEGGWKIADLD
jgi:hypothetical protein